MIKKLTGFCVAAMLIALAAGPTNTFTPGSRVQVLSHNAFPDHGKYGDRLDRALAAGLPTAIEQDLAWVDGKSLLIHGPRAVGTDDPTLESYFIPKVKPIIEKALKDGNKGNWPLIRYDAWLTKAEKTPDISKQSPLELKPLMVIVEDKGADDLKQQFFYDAVPVGGKIRVFGSPDKFDENPMKLPREQKEEAVAMMVNRDPEQLVSKKADNYRRWFGVNWGFVEKGGETKAGEWAKASEARLKKFVDFGHRLGYFVGFYCLDGYSATEDQGWDKSYNFGSKEKVAARWQALVRAHADFISTDQVEEVARVIKGAR